MRLPYLYVGARLQSYMQFHRIGSGFPMRVCLRLHDSISLDPINLRLGWV